MFLVYLFSFGSGACRETLPFCYGWWLILRRLILLTLYWYRDVNILLTGLLLSNTFYVTLRNIVSECYYTRTYIARILYSHFFSLNIILKCYEGNIIGQKNTLRIQYACGWSSSTSPQRIDGTPVILAERKHGNVVCTSIYRYLSVITMRVRAREWESETISVARATRDHCIDLIFVVFLA